MTEPAPIPNLAAVVRAAVDEAVVRDPRCTAKIPPHPLTLDRTILESPADPEPWPAVDIGRFLDELPDMESRTPTPDYGGALLDMDKLNRFMTAYADLAPIEPLELTQEQWDLAKATFPEAAPGTPRPIFCVPVHVVERIEDSTPFKLWLEKVKAECAEATTVPFPEIGAQWRL